MNLLNSSLIKPRRVYSQSDQDGIIESVFGQIGTTNKFCVEFGFNSQSLTGGSGANAARLILEDGWRGLLLDSSFSNPSINLHKEFLTPENIGSVFRRHGVPSEPDFVSIDVDSVDLWLFKGMLQAGFRPRLVSIEYNSNFSIDESVTMPIGVKWQEDACYGASLLALYEVGREYKYSLVAVSSLLDVFFVPSSLCSAEHVPTLEYLAQFTGLPAHRVPTMERRKLLAKYPSMEPLTNTPWDRAPYSPDILSKVRAIEASFKPV